MVLLTVWECFEDKALARGHTAWFTGNEQGAGKSCCHKAYSQNHRKFGLEETLNTV